MRFIHAVQCLVRVWWRKARAFTYTIVFESSLSADPELEPAAADQVGGACVLDLGRVSVRT